MLKHLNVIKKVIEIMKNKMKKNIKDRKGNRKLHELQLYDKRKIQQREKE